MTLHSQQSKGSILFSPVLECWCTLYVIMYNEGPQVATGPTWQEGWQHGEQEEEMLWKSTSPICNQQGGRLPGTVN